MAVSNFYTTVGLIDDSAMTLRLGMVRSSRNLAYYFVSRVQSRNIFGSNNQHHPRYPLCILTLPNTLLSFAVYQALTHQIEPDYRMRNRGPLIPT